MLEIVYSTQFKKDFKKVRKLLLPDLKAVFEVIQALEKQRRLQGEYKDHCLSGHYIDFRKCLSSLIYYLFIKLVLLSLNLLELVVTANYSNSKAFLRRV